MRTIKEVMAIVCEVEAISGEVLQDFPYKVNGRLTKTAGRCRSSRSTGQVIGIELSKTTMNLDYNNFRQVVLHELAHAIEIKRHGDSNHGERFKRICASIGCYEDGVRMTDTEAFTKASIKTAKYTVTCDCCGNTFHFKRKTENLSLIMRFPKNNPMLRCAKCTERSFTVKQNY